MISCPCGRRGNDHLVGRLGSDPSCLGRRAACHSPGRRSGPCCGLCRLCGGRGDRGHRCRGAVCCVCRRSRSRGCHGGGRLGAGARHTNHSGRGLADAGRAVCCFAVEALVGARPSLTLTSMIFFCVGGGLGYGEYYVVR